MFEGLVTFLSFLEVYVVPIIFAIGVILFFYGFINSFLIDRPDVGHPNMLHACFTFTLALIAYAIVGGLQWLMTSPFSVPSLETERERGEYGAEVNREGSLLPVPNAPRGNE